MEAEPGLTADQYYERRATYFNVRKARLGLVMTTIPAANLYARLLGPTIDLVTITVMAPTAIPFGGAKLVQSYAGTVDDAAQRAANKASAWADAEWASLTLSEITALKGELRALARTLQNLPDQRPTMVSGASDLGTLEHYYEYSGWKATPNVVMPGGVHPTLQLRMREITDVGVESLEDWSYIPNCAEFKLVNNALWNGVPEEGLLLGTMRVRDFTLGPV